MQRVHAVQIKAARAMLDWSREDLAAATGLSVNTIRNLEMGFISPRENTNYLIRKVFEDSGLEFIEPDGVRRCYDDIKIFHGTDSCERFFEDLMQTARGSMHDVLFVVDGYSTFAQVCGVDDKEKAGGAEWLGAVASVKVLLSSYDSAVCCDPHLSFRQIRKTEAGPAQYCIYGGKQALIIPQGGAYRFVILNAANVATSYRAYFAGLWETALPLLPEALAAHRYARVG